MEWLATFFKSYVDGSLLDILSLVVAFAYVMRQRCKLPAEQRCNFWSRQTGRAMANALTLFPLGLLALSIVSSKLTEWLLSGSKITLTIAGGYALFAMLEDQSEKNAALAIEAPAAFTGPPAPPQLAPAKHAPLLQHSFAMQDNQAGKVLVHGQSPVRSAKSERRPRARGKKKTAAQQNKNDGR